MLLEREDWHRGYSQIVRDCRPSSTNGSLLSPAVGGTVLMLCNPDADALCAARILSYAFRADNVLYQLRPCGGCTRLTQILEKLLKVSNPSLGDDQHQDGVANKYCPKKKTRSNTIKAIVLINFGGSKNLTKLLFAPIARKTGPDGTVIEVGRCALLDPEVTSVHVIDSHRPYHLANVHSGLNIVLWNDFSEWHNNEEAGGLPSDGDGLSGDDDSEDSDDSSSNSEDSNDTDSELESDEEEAEFDSGIAGNLKDDHTTKIKAMRSKMGLNLSKDTTYDGDEDVGVEEDYADEDGKFEDKQEPSRDQSRKRSLLNDEDDTYTSKRKRQDDSSQEMDNLSQSTAETQDYKGQQNDISTPELSSQPGESDHNILSIKNQRNQRRNKIRRYYASGTYYSSPVSFMVYTLLSTQLRFEAVGDLLWLACIGVTDAYVHSRLDLEGYDLFSRELKRHVYRVYPDTSGDSGILERSANAFYAESLYDGTQLTQTKVGVSENGRILFQEEEFRFFLLRHSSLWDAMTLSPYVYTSLELWKNAGKNKLKEMLAKMGLPIVQCRQPYAFMKPGLKRRLRKMVLEHAKEYGIDNVAYTGFLRVTGYKSLLSAGDVSLAITALLECNTSNNKRKQQDDQDRALVSHMSIEDEEENDLVQSFNVAYDALNSNGSSCAAIAGLGRLVSEDSFEGSDLSNLVNGGQMIGSGGLGAGIRLSMHLQKAIISTAVNLIERNAITRLSHFRYAYLHHTNHGSNDSTSNADAFHKEDREQQNPVFSKPLALTKLAHFLMDMHRSNNKWTGTRARPLVLMSEKPRSGTYIVVGYEFPEERGSVGKNRFGQNFLLASKTIRGTFKFDSFDANVVEVKASDVQNFIEQLHYMMDSI
mmetsp:Transcript_6417/g.9325  ORF Transcript_6417/g.9325 Transcript_6417/m.9325 type:complete len:872 (-) Transcript_6417:111-2726(-)|eukprot:CAMPEP_0184863616 /NCGR_PEP_ID=MMETSP0580-20130426/11895_1 /TAXON_ID=1118495 /ORGANISM="Dactyliosolen fragilissimus" /LENGTH=871 /DNA_ID=CAMNT_0027362057 /DNA_START=183 /DNA_END=2801 /DNA_ORIENTATION=-